MDSKNDVIKETKTEIRKLTLNDRCLIRAFLGYEAVENLHAGVKQKINASIFTRASLWPDDIEENNQMGESNNEKTTPPPYKLSTWVNEKGINSVPSIFPLHLQELQELFIAGSLMNDIQETSVIRTFQVSFLSFAKKKKDRLV